VLPKHGAEAPRMESNGTRRGTCLPKRKRKRAEKPWLFVGGMCVCVRWEAVCVCPCAWPNNNNNGEGAQKGAWEGSKVYTCLLSFSFCRPAQQRCIGMRARLGSCVCVLEFTCLLNFQRSELRKNEENPLSFTLWTTINFNLIKSATAGWNCSFSGCCFSPSCALYTDADTHSHTQTRVSREFSVRKNPQLRRVVAADKLEEIEWIAHSRSYSVGWSFPHMLSSDFSSNFCCIFRCLRTCSPFALTSGKKLTDTLALLGGRGGDTSMKLSMTWNYRCSTATIDICHNTNLNWMFF